MQVLRRNMKNLVEPDNLDSFRFVSSGQLFSNPLFIGIKKSPCPEGDVGIYWTRDNGKILGMCSFAISERSLDVLQIQGARMDNLPGQDKRAISYLPWEMALLDVVETSARWCEADKVRVVSCSRYSSCGKNLAIRYDVSAIERGYCPEDGWWAKSINT